MEDYYIKTVLSQYANNTTLIALLDSFNAAIDPTPLIDEFYTKVINVATAEGYGLDVWGRIVVIERVLQIPVLGTFFGFSEMGTDANGFGQGQFYSNAPSISTNYTLTDQAFYLVIMAKAAANISDGSLKSYNNLLMMLFPGRGNAYVIDNMNMTATLQFNFALAPFELAILGQSNIFTPPSGVQFLINVTV